MIVLRGLGFELGKRAPALPELRVEPSAPEIPILLQRPSQDGNLYWDARPNTVAQGEAVFWLVDLFDWNELDWRDFGFCRARIASWSGHEELIGRHVLIEMRHVTFTFTV
jgi:hypothetical protein